MAGVGFVINDIYAFLAVHADGDEGIMAMRVPDSPVEMPLIAADIQRLQDLRPYAVAAAKKTGVQIKLVRFTTRTELEVIEP